MQLGQCSTSSEQELHSKLDISGRGNNPIPYAKVGARHIGGEGRTTETLVCTIKDVPIPDIKELGPELQTYSLGELCILAQTEIVVVEARPANVANPRSLAIVGVKTAHRLKGRYIENRLIGRELTLA